MTAPLGFVVLSKRPNPEGGFDLEPVKLRDGRYAPCVRHRICGRCRAIGPVEYVIGEIRQWSKSE